MHNNLPKVFIFLDHYNNQIFKNNITNIGIIYRNYNDSKRETELIKIAKACKKNRYQLFVSNDIKLAIKVKSDGIYIPSFNKKKGFLNLENKNFIILGSAHNQIEIQEKISQRCSAIFLSPVFSVKKTKNYLGINKFNLLSYSSKVSVLALGGINQNNMRKLKMLHINGFGGIRIFKKKPAYKRSVFLKNNFF